MKKRIVAKKTGESSKASDDLYRDSRRSSSPQGNTYVTCSKLFIVCALESVLTGLRSLSSDPDYRCLGHPFVDGFLAECLGNAYELACLRIDQEALYGNLKFDPRSESSYWQVDEEGQKLYYNWWKNNIERKKGYFKILDDASMHSNVAPLRPRDIQRRNLCRAIVAYSENIRAHFAAVTRVSGCVAEPHIVPGPLTLLPMSVTRARPPSLAALSSIASRAAAAVQIVAYCNVRSSSRKKARVESSVLAPAHGRQSSQASERDSRVHHNNQFLSEHCESMSDSEESDSSRHFSCLGIESSDKTSDLLFPSLGRDEPSDDHADRPAYSNVQYM